MIPLDLAQANSAVELKKQKELAIVISKDGVIYFNEKQINKNEIRLKLLSYKGDTPISIACDKSLKFDGFISILDILKEKKFTNISIVTKQK